MKCLKRIFTLVVITIVIASCDDKINPIVSFDSPFPKRNIYLSNILGDKVFLKRGADTIVLEIFSQKDFNIIRNFKTKDTVYNGKVCRYRGLYFFSDKFNDTTYFIHAVRITDEYIYGFGERFYQGLLIDSVIRHGEYKNIVKHNDSISGVRIRTDKRELRRLFSSIVDKAGIDTIIKPKSKLVDEQKVLGEIKQTESDDYLFVSKIYPNPVVDILNVETLNHQCTYQIIDIKGKIVAKGDIAGSKINIDLNHCAKGLYVLTIINNNQQQKETIKILKK